MNFVLCLSLGHFDLYQALLKHLSVNQSTITFFIRFILVPLSLSKIIISFLT